MHMCTPTGRRTPLSVPAMARHGVKGEAGEFADRVLREAQTEEWIDRAAALDLLQRFRNGRPEVTWRQVWVLIVFSLWHQIYIERVYDPVALGWAPQPPAVPVGYSVPAPAHLISVDRRPRQDHAPAG